MYNVYITINYVINLLCIAKAFVKVVTSIYLTNAKTHCEKVNITK